MRPLRRHPQLLQYIATVTFIRGFSRYGKRHPWAGHSTAAASRVGRAPSPVGAGVTQHHQPTKTRCTNALALGRSGGMTAASMPSQRRAVRTITHTKCWQRCSMALWRVCVCGMIQLCGRPPRQQCRASSGNECVRQQRYQAGGLVPVLAGEGVSTHMPDAPHPRPATLALLAASCDPRAAASHQQGRAAGVCWPPPPGIR